MTLFPFDEITYQTRLSEVEVKKRLADLVEPVKIFRIRDFRKKSKPYEGKLNGMKFKINRIISYRNSFLPVITGDMRNQISGITIMVKMRLHLFVFLFLILWFGFAGFGIIITLTYAFKNEDFNLWVLVPTGMFIAAYIGIMAAFKYESSKSKKDLEKLFEAQIIK